MANSVDPDQTAIGAVCSRSTLFASILNSPVMLGTYLQQFLFCLVFAMSLCPSVYMCCVVTCWERADLLALVCGV